MNTVVYNIQLDLLKAGVQDRVVVKKGNAGSVKLVVRFRRGSVPYELAEDVTAVFSALKPDGNPLFNNCTVENGAACYRPTTQTLAVAGIVKCELALYGTENHLLFSPCFELYVEDTVTNDEAIESTDEFNALTQAITAMKYTHIRYAERRPLLDSDMLETPNAWIGIYHGSSQTAPTAHTEYEWTRIRGDTGRGFMTLGFYATLNELITERPEPEDGDAYGIGTEAPYSYYIYDGVGTRWVNAGTLSGVGVPLGGADEDVLAKVGANNYATAWMGKVTNDEVDELLCAQLDETHTVSVLKEITIEELEEIMV